MPIYVYECNRCTYKDEFLLPIDKALKTLPCPKCNAKMVKQVTAYAYHKIRA